MRQIILIVDASGQEQICLKLKGVEHRFSSLNLSENLILEIKKFFKKQKLGFNDLDKIEIITDNGFSKTRTVVATANALIFALGLKQNFFKAKYSKAPNITLSKK